MLRRYIRLWKTKRECHCQLTLLGVTFVFTESGGYADLCIDTDEGYIPYPYRKRKYMYFAFGS